MASRPSIEVSSTGQSGSARRYRWLRLHDVVIVVRLIAMALSAAGVGSDAAASPRGSGWRLRGKKSQEDRRNRAIDKGFWRDKGKVPIWAPQVFAKDGRQLLAGKIAFAVRAAGVANTVDQVPHSLRAASVASARAGHISSKEVKEDHRLNKLANTSKHSVNSAQLAWAQKLQVQNAPARWEDLHDDNFIADTGAQSKMQHSSNDIVAPSVVSPPVAI